MSMSNPKVVMVGGGSVNWGPRLMNDLLLTPALSECEIVLFDIDLSAAEKVAELGRKLVSGRDLGVSLTPTSDEEEAFEGADFVIITISTGGLDAMAHDLKIPEDYGIYQTVGDTVGPGGWARGLRNIPVFADMAKNIERLAPNATVLNYTNPMATLTKTITEVTDLKTVGLCHGLFECYDVLMAVFGLESEKQVKVRFGGTNHFFWIKDLWINGKDGYKLLDEKLDGRNFAELVTEVHHDEAGFHSDKWVAGELYDLFGYLPYLGDRHICEFFPHYLSPDEGKLGKYKLERTFIEDRYENRKDARKRLDSYLSEEEKLPSERSRETAADIISAMVKDEEFVDVVNVPNIGQISNLPAGAVVETLGVVNSAGFTPLSIGPLPSPINGLVRRHCENQDMIVEAALKGDGELAFYALYNDPLCSHLDYPEVKEMGEKLLDAQSEFISV